MCCCAVVRACLLAPFARLLTCVTEGLQALEEEQAGLERYLEAVKEQNAELQAWLVAHPAAEIDPDTIVRTLSGWQLQRRVLALTSCLACDPPWAAGTTARPLVRAVA